MRASGAAIAAWNKQNGYDDPVIVQYLRYMNNLLHGNFGYSYAENQTVAALFAERLARSVYLSGISLLIAILIALPLGIFQAVKRNTLGDNVATSLAFILYSMPVVLPRADPHPGVRALVPHLQLRGEPVQQRVGRHGRLALHVAARS